MEFPENSGFSGIWADGIAQFNNTTWTLNATNPDSNGQTYNYEYWPNVLNKTVSKVEQEWRETNDAESAREYLSRFEYSISKPNTYTAAVKPPKLSKKWNKVAGIIKSGSWKAIFAETESEYNQIVAETKRMADKAGYAECSRWCEREARRRHASEE